MPSNYTVDLSLDECLERLNNQQRETRLANGYTLAIKVIPTEVGIGAYRVEVSRVIRGFRRGRRSAVYVFLKRTGGTITRVSIRNTEQPIPLILGAVLVAFGIIMAFRGSPVVAGLCLLLGAGVLAVVWMLYSGRLIPRDLTALVEQTLPARSP